jgi:hypothetical protein
LTIVASTNATAAPSDATASTLLGAGPRRRPEVTRTRSLTDGVAVLVDKTLL